MEHRLKKWEIALLVGVVTALLWGTGTARAGEELSGQVLRLHVIANSDTPEDQALKLVVRDAALAALAGLEGQADSADEMASLVAGQLGTLEQAGEAALRSRGCGQEVWAEVTNCYFPTKVYDGFALPAGEYTALRLVIGAGEGQNWWCVAFPPLCAGVGAKSVEEAVDAGYFSPEQGELLAADAGIYHVRFKSLELLGQLRQLLKGAVSEMVTNCNRAW